MALDAADKFCSVARQGVECDRENRYHALEWLQYADLQQRNFPASMHDLNRMNSIYMEMRRRKEDGKFGGEYSAWLYRMYARQQMATLNLNVEPDGLFDVSTATSATHLLPPPIWNTEPKDLYWKTFSESGALLARVSRLAVESPSRFKNVTEVESLIHSRFLDLQKASANISYVGTLVVIDYRQAVGIWEYLVKNNTQTGLANLKEAARLEMGNVQNSDSPTLPVIPALETYAMYLDFFNQSGAPYWQYSRSRWHYRTQWQMK
jgi:hypothetical protein